ncbi:MAG: metal-dependent hydrolase [Pseudomonadota bacterium]
MDPISQGAIAAAAAQTRARREQMIAFTWFGALAGMAPDLDVLIQSPTDPLLFLEFHRHFTHAIVFIPVGALIVAGALFKILRHPLNFRQAYLACLLGYATHALLDACTSYGTQLFWPFSNMRVSWNNVSVVDPLFTLPLLALVVTAALRKAPKFAVMGLIWAVTYLSFGAVQLHRATAAAEALAESRGHTPHRLTMKPSFANLLIWKSIYEFEDAYYVDGIRTGFTPSVCVGQHVEKLHLPTHLPDLQADSQQARDIERFRWFSDDYLAYHQGGIVDMRYSMVPNEVDPMWGVKVDSNKADHEHVVWWSERNMSDEKRSAFGAMLAGRSCSELPP